MLNNQLRREILDTARATGFEGSIVDLYQMANQGNNVPAMLQAEAQAKQENIQQNQNQAQELQSPLQSPQPQQSISPAPKLNVDMNPTQMGSQSHLVQSGNLTDIGMAPTGTGSKSAAEISNIPYQTGGYKAKNIESLTQPTGIDDQSVIPERTFDAFKNLDVVKDSYKVIPQVSPDKLDNYTEYDNKLVKKSDIKNIEDNTIETLKDFEGDPYYDIIKPIIEKDKKEDLKKLKNYREFDRDDYVGSNILRSYEYYKDKGNKDYKLADGEVSVNAPAFKAMDKVLPKLDTLTDAELQEFTGLINNLSSPYTKGMSEDEDFGVIDALRILRKQDISGIKKYREKMELSKDDVLDLVQVPEGSNFAVRSLLKLVKAGIKRKDFKDGGYKYSNGGGKLKLPPLGSTPAIDMNSFINQELNNQNSSLDTNPAAQVIQGQQLTDKLVTEDKNLYKKTMAKIQDNNKKGIAPSPSDIALMKAGPDAQFNTTNIIADNTFKPQKQGEIRDKVKDNMRAIAANSFLTSQIAGGYGRDVVNKQLEDQSNFEEKFGNVMSYTGQNTMRNVGLGVISGGSSQMIANNPATSNFMTRALSYPVGKTGQGINTLITQGSKMSNLKKVGTGLNTLYHSGYITGLDDLVSSSTQALAEGVSGERSGVDASLQLGKNALNYVPAIKGFNTANRYLQPITRNYSKIKTTAKALHDLYQGNPEDAAIRMTEIFGGGNSKYFKKYIRKLVPDNVKKDIFSSTSNMVATPAFGGPTISPRGGMDLKKRSK